MKIKGKVISDNLLVKVLKEDAKVKKDNNAFIITTKSENPYIKVKVVNIGWNVDEVNVNDICLIKKDCGHKIEEDLLVIKQDDVIYITGEK